MEFICKWNYAEHCIFGYTIIEKIEKKEKKPLSM